MLHMLRYLFIYYKVIVGYMLYREERHGALHTLSSLHIHKVDTYMLRSSTYAGALSG